MNRLQRWSADIVEPALISRVDAATFHHAQQRDWHYSLFAPLHYEPNYAYPLLVWLHGPGDDERQVLRVLPHLSLRNYVAVGPRGCCAPDPGGLGFQWRQRASAITAAQERVFEAIDLARHRYHVADDRIFLAGYQCGGTMALRIALQDPARFAGVLSVGGPFPTGLAPLAHWRQIRKLSIFIAQGRDSETYPFLVTREELRLFHSAALHVTLRQYPCGDELTTQMLHDMNVWMMERVTGVPAESPDDVPVSPSDVN